MKYFFVLGNHPALSIAEIKAVLLGSKVELVDSNILLVDTPEKINGRDLIARLGGTIKIGEIFDELLYQPHALFTASLKILSQIDKVGKFNFGLSYYGQAKLDTRKVGLALKQELKGQGVSCRLVVSREKTLSSVVVQQNKLTTSGCELVYIKKDKKILIGVTIAVQPFKELSARDYGRPARDDYSGMLPPKLAQIMINLAQAKKDDLILDPFCGSGTILTEAMVMGYRNIYGSDISKKAISDSQDNIQWLQKKYKNLSTPKLNISDVNQIHLFFKENSVNSVISETYLGPQRGSINIKKTTTELAKFYEKVFKQLFLILKPGGRIVIALPALMIKSEPSLLDLSFKPLKIITTNLKITNGITKRGTLLYGRVNQRVWREIIILEK